MRLARIVLLALIAVAAIVIAALPTSSSSNHSADVAAALSMAEMNNELAEGAPQQTVVNGWVARDLLAIMSEQLDEQNTATDRKVPMLLALVVLALVVIGLTDPRIHPGKETPDVPAEYPSQPTAPSAFGGVAMTPGSAPAPPAG